MFLLNPSYAQQRGIQVKVVTQAGQSIDLYRESYALVIGVSDYTHGWPRIPNAVRDAREVGDELKKHGFHITLLENPASAQLKEGIEKFIASYGLDEHNRLLFYFAGHGHTAMIIPFPMTMRIFGKEQKNERHTGRPGCLGRRTCYGPGTSRLGRVSASGSV